MGYPFEQGGIWHYRLVHGAQLSKKDYPPDVRDLLGGCLTRCLSGDFSRPLQSVVRCRPHLHSTPSVYPGDMHVAQACERIQRCKRAIPWRDAKNGEIRQFAQPCERRKALNFKAFARPVPTRISRQVELSQL